MINTYSYISTLNKVKTLLRDLTEKLISPQEFFNSVLETDLDILSSVSVDYTLNPKIISRGKTYVSGVAQGVVTFKNDHFVDEEKKILITNHLSSQGLCCLSRISGAIVQNEDPTSHAVIVARSMGTTLLAQVEEFQWISENQLKIGDAIFTEGDHITIDGFNGNILKGNVPLFIAPQCEIYDQVMALCEQYADIKVHGNADTPVSTKKSLQNGSQGIEPRTEHMFFQDSSLSLFKCLVVSHNTLKEDEILKQLQILLEESLTEIFSLSSPLPVVIRLFDPPLHEFLPSNEQEIIQIASILETSQSFIQDRIEEMREINPMMGLRGARLLITRPKLAIMQIRAIFNAALITHYNKPWISIPMVIDPQEIHIIKDLIEQERKAFEKSKQVKIEYLLGAMIETPRAVYMIDHIAPYLNFISFGTNDLTAQTFGFSRGDIFKKFLGSYLEKKILPFDPFYQLDDAVKDLVERTVQGAKKVNPNIHIGLCGEQGTCKDTVYFCHQLGIKSISCNMLKIKHVKLFAAQAALSI